MDELFGQMKELVESYDTHSMQLSLAGDLPRRVFRRSAEALLGERVWELIHDAHGDILPAPAFDSLTNRVDVPWDQLIDTDRPEVRNAILQFADAIEPELRTYLEAIDEQARKDRNTSGDMSS